MALSEATRRRATRVRRQIRASARNRVPRAAVALDREDRNRQRPVEKTHRRERSPLSALHEPDTRLPRGHDAARDHVRDFDGLPRRSVPGRYPHRGRVDTVVRESPDRTGRSGRRGKQDQHRLDQRRRCLGDTRVLGRRAPVPGHRQQPAYAAVYATDPSADGDAGRETNRRLHLPGALRRRLHSARLHRHHPDPGLLRAHGVHQPLPHALYPTERRHPN